MPRVEINGQVVEFASMPTPEDIDHVAGTLGKPTTTTTATTTTPLTGLVQATDPLRFGRRHPAMTGQVLGGAIGTALAPETGGLSLLIPAVTGFLGGVGGSAIERGGAPTTGDVVTAGVGEALPLVPGAARGATRLLSERAAPRLM